MKKEVLSQVTLILGILKIVLIIVLGIFILMSSHFDYLPKYFRTIFAVVIMGYGFFRLVGIIYKLKNRRYKK